MVILEHRGGWCAGFSGLERKSLQNSMAAFRASVRRGNGIETDFRDLNGALVVSHDLPGADTVVSAEVFFELCAGYDGLIAINIKSDGLQDVLKKLLNKYGIKNYFCFDMSIPDAYLMKNCNLNYFLRESEYEKLPEKYNSKLYELCNGIWLDKFLLEGALEGRMRRLKTHLSKGKSVSIVSPELHLWGRNFNLHRNIWVQLKKDVEQLLDEGIDITNLSLCTDFPVQAKEFFDA